MTKPETLTKLRELHDQLVEITEGMTGDNGIDQETIDLLGQLVTDVNELHDKAESSGQPVCEVPEHGAIVEQINRLESEHPQIVRFLSQLTDILAMMGI